MTTTLTEGSRQQEEGWSQRAAEECQRRLEADPGDAVALHRLGVQARQAGQLENAVEFLMLSLQADGNNPAAIVHLAETLQQMGRSEEAIDFYRAAVEAAPRNAGIHTSLGNALRAADQLGEAVGCYLRAIKLDPESAAAHGNLGAAYQARGEWALAIASYRRAKRLDPRSEQIMANLGGCLVSAGQHGDAIEVLTRGVKKHPQSRNGYLNLSVAYLSANKLPEAEQAAWKALEIDPRCALALNNLGNALKAQGEYTRALNCFAKAQQLDPRCHLAYNNLGSTLSEIGRSAEALQALRCAHQMRPENAVIFSNYLLTLNYVAGISRAEVQAEHRRFGAELAQPLTVTAAPHANRPDPERRLRIGYVSGDLREHPVANFVEPMLACHATADFEVFAYANHWVRDAVSERLRGHVQKWREVAGLTDAELAAQIREDGIDILVDLSGHTAGNRLLAFACKPAPVQVSMIGYMQTTGLSAIDYRITDENLDPIADGDAHSVEKLVRLSTGAATFRPPGDCPSVNELPARQAGYVTFASFNNLAKVTPEVLATWAEILHALPNSRLLMVGRAGGSAAEILHDAGIAAERLEFLDRQTMPDYLALHRRVDVMLDTFPYNGGTTTLLAAWMGVPFITLAGATPTARAGANLLRGLGLPQLAASDPADYIRRALATAGDLDTLSTWRRELRGRLSPMLNDGTQYTRALEAAYREMWRTWCAAAK